MKSPAYADLNLRQLEWLTVDELIEIWDATPGLRVLHQCHAWRCRPPAEGGHQNWCDYVAVCWSAAITRAKELTEGRAAVISGRDLEQSTVGHDPGSSTDIAVAAATLLGDPITVEVCDARRQRITNGRHRLTAMHSQGVDSVVPVLVDVAR